MLLPLAVTAAAQAQESRTEIRVRFPVNVTKVDPAFDGNAAQLDRIVALIESGLSEQSGAKLAGVTYCGWASPEGRYDRNLILAKGRRDNLAAYVRARVDIPDSLVTLDGAAIDWPGLAALVEADTAMPGREEALDVLLNEPERTYDAQGRLTASRKDRLMRLRYGRTWHYMQEHFFPLLRWAGAVILTFREEPQPQPEPARRDTLFIAPEPEPVLVPEPEPAPQAEPAPENHYWSLHTNLLYDALLLPNVGAELYLGRDWSLHGNWMYGWWDRRSRHRWWRAYGGELAVRRWFGRLAERKPLTGHHLGLYAQVLTYDFEFGGKGYMGGVPGKNIFRNPSYAFGVEYGFALPVARRLNLDFSIGAGYLGGKYYEYYPVDGCYVWGETKRRHWFGPTKLAVSLVWLIGHGNINNRKGGEQ